MSKLVNLRLVGVLGVAAMLFLVSREHAWLHSGWVDIKAALLVFVTPWFVLLFARKDRLSIKSLLGRAREVRTFSNDALVNEMKTLTEKLKQGGINSDLIKLAGNCPDSYLRYCAELYSSKFDSQELSTLLQQKLEREDEYWQGLNLIFGFLAKMAPYFGMLATVIGMIQLLQNMQDFSRISSGMALALQGTLYGLVSFVLIYSPLQKWSTGFREWLYRRNSMVAHWFIMVSQQRDPSLIAANLEIESDVLGG